MRRKLLVANWKMHKNISEAQAFCRRFLPEIEECDRADIAICPPFTLLTAVKGALGSSKVKLGAQNLFWEEKGAYTGEVSPAMLLDAGCEMVIIGHSERRHIFGETDEMINRKVKAALRNKLIPILCVGETLEERKKGQAEEVVKRQLLEGLRELEYDGEIVIAYEPVWAIGTGVNASPDDAQKMSFFIRQILKGIFPEEKVLEMRILYGGSVKPENITGFTGQPDVDGALVGGASLDPDSFAEIVRLSCYA
ncbi:MAG: triose-phosphate isomerase [Thermosyntropha sp.]|nr:triose-phosphate isomerase [Thermosyntropha sp.]